MKNKRIVVLLKFYKGELNPFDASALEVALSLNAKEVIALTMSPESVLGAFKSLTRLGVKGVLVSDTAYAGSDTQATSYILSKALKKLNPDLVFCGRQSVDGDTGQVPIMIAKRLNYAIKTKVINVDGESFTLRNGETFIPKDKMVITFEKMRSLRFPSIFSKLNEVEIWDNKILGLEKERCGLNGSPTRVIKSYESSVGRRDCKFIKVEDLDSVIRLGLQKEKVVTNSNEGAKLEKVYYVGNIEEIAKKVANSVIGLETDKKDSQEIAKEIIEKGIKTVLWEDSEKLKILASEVAVLTGAGLCADCISFRVDNNRLVMTRPALGGNVTADIVCVSDIAFATVRTVKNEKTEVIFSVGKGAIDSIEKIENLAKKYGAEICCSRIVADSGKLPYEKQVGLTGKTVSPKVYVAFGISGAVQHTSAISGAGTIIAINKDKQARIFDYADYGIVTEVENVKL